LKYQYTFENHNLVYNHDVLVTVDSKDIGTKNYDLNDYRLQMINQIEDYYKWLMDNLLSLEFILLHENRIDVSENTHVRKDDIKEKTEWAKEWLKNKGKELFSDVYKLIARSEVTEESYNKLSRSINRLRERYHIISEDSGNNLDHIEAQVNWILDAPYLIKDRINDIGIGTLLESTYKDYFPVESEYYVYYEGQQVADSNMDCLFL
jgi:hypothetical protein